MSSFSTEPSDDGLNKIVPDLMGIVAVVAAVPFALSAVYGYVEVADCNEAPEPRSGERGSD